MIKELAFVAYSVRDVPAAVAFYRDVIGLTPGESFGDQWAEFEVGSATFGVGNGDAIGIDPGSQCSAAFEVDDLAATRQLLEERKVPLSEVYESPVCTSCFVTDPRATASRCISASRAS